MARLFSSFLVRLWRTSKSQRIEIEHIQSGEKGLVTTVADAVDWISVRADDALPAAPGQTEPILSSVVGEEDEDMKPGGTA